jgi:hypothetical protein
MAEEIEKKEEAPKEKPKVKVTSTKTIDFPTLGWAINAGETCELPVDEEAQKEILSKEFITKVK